MNTKSIILLAVLLMFSASLSAQKPVLRFNEQGKFKIVQFTDTHLGTGEGASEYRCLQAEKTLARISRVVKQENPDFIVLTGDIVTGGDASQTWARILDSLASFRTPFCIVYGNHDPERKLTREQMSKPIAAPANTSVIQCLLFRTLETPVRVASAYPPILNHGLLPSYSL